MDGRISTIGTLIGHLSSPASISGEMVMPTYIDVDLYGGSTEITPSDNTQVLPTANKTVTKNIVINPIPSNYGLISWNGSTLTVS